MTDTDRMAEMRANGATFEEIATAFGMTRAGIHYRLGGARSYPDNSNDNHRVTRFAAHNGGCSTRSGMQPVTLVRIPSIDGVAA